MWEPFEPSVAEVARVLSAGGRLVSFTHEWAIERKVASTSTLGQDWAAEICAAHGLGDARHWRGTAEHGTSIAFTATKDH